MGDRPQPLGVEKAGARTTIASLPLPERVYVIAGVRPMPLPSQNRFCVYASLSHLCSYFGPLASAPSKRQANEPLTPGGTWHAE